MCNCIETMNTMLAEHNTRVELPIIGPQRPFVRLIKVDERRRGKLPHLLATFCPFCGGRYEGLVPMSIDVGNSGEVTP